MVAAVAATGPVVCHNVQMGMGMVMIDAIRNKKLDWAGLCQKGDTAAVAAVAVVVGVVEQKRVWVVNNTFSFLLGLSLLTAIAEMSTDQNS